PPPTRLSNGSTQSTSTSPTSPPRTPPPETPDAHTPGCARTRTAPAPHRRTRPRPHRGGGSMSDLIVDLFAGPGGWSTGLRALGLREIGLDSDSAACTTLVAAGPGNLSCD